VGVLRDHLGDEVVVVAGLAQSLHHFGPVDVAFQQVDESVEGGDAPTEVLQVHLANAPPQDLENEHHDTFFEASIFNVVVKGIFVGIKLLNDADTYRKTGFFPYADYIKYGKKINNEKKTKKPIFGDELKQSLIINSNPPLYPETYTNERLKNLNKYQDNPGAHLIAIGYGEGLGIVISPVLQKYIRQT